MQPAALPDESSLSEGFTRIEAVNTLEPGHYWRVVKVIPVTSDRWGSRLQLIEGDIHLLADLYEFEGALHSAIILSHPRDGKGQELRILIADFLGAFEPVTQAEAEANRAASQAQIMDEVNGIQEEMAQAEINPLALPDVQAAATKAVERFEADEAAKIQVKVQDTAKRQSDLRKLHRRAARRSEAKGNPIALRRSTISDRLDVMIAEGVTSDGVYELSLEAGRRIAVAQATGKWLEKRAENMAALLSGLAPYYAERGAVAIARSKKAMTYVATLSQGIASLQLYTGDGIDVMPVSEGADAPTDEPLTLFQGKRFMDEELAVWADVDDSFDWTSQDEFFKAMATNPALRDQVLPTPRSVVSMAVTRRHIDYSDVKDAYEAMVSAAQIHSPVGSSNENRPRITG